MKNKNMGFLLMGIAVLIGYIIFTFNQALDSIVSSACSHGAECPMWGTIEFQTNVSMGIMAFVVLVGLYLVLSGKEKNGKGLESSKENLGKSLDGLEGDERAVMEKVVESNGTIFQSQLVEATGLAKVKVSRILDRLEGKGLIERRRRGMTNVVILKHK